MSKKSTQANTSTKHANDVLGGSLDALDAIIMDAQQQQKKKRRQVTSSTSEAAWPQRGGSVFAVMTEPHFRALKTIVMLYGVQLMPSLDAILRRVLLCMSSPALVSSESWELAAMLGTYFRAGATRLLEEVLLLFLSEKNTFVLGSPCMVIEGTGGKGNENDHGAPGIDNRKQWAVEGWTYEYSTTHRNLRAFEELLTALGPFVATATMQRTLLRYTQEVVVYGLLSSQAATDQSGRKPRDGKEEHQQQQREPEERGVDASLKPQCIDLLTSLLVICRPLPSNAAACAVRAVKELPMHSFSPYGGVEHHQLLRAVTRLSVTLTALRHPYALPFYLPPRDVVERPTRLLVLEEINGSNKGEGVSSEETPHENGVTIAFPQDHHRQPRSGGSSAYSGRPEEPTQVASPAGAMVPKEPVKTTGTGSSHYVATAASSDLLGSLKRQRTEPINPPPPASAAPVADRGMDDDDVEIPNIDMED
uniref:Uncharacterized protein n=1 Tax=Trypanosoma congolense (strain IL3000) TaxID=1068625 RepID=G0UVL7_TRYCI|nr:conserved hypothetical protein [Trypanosoma congolense IL3000]